jgi:predicted RNase H-like HicB family nuclease
MTLTALIHKADEGGYWAEVPELPGCLTQGETLDELQCNLQDAVGTWLEAAAEDGQFEFEPALLKWKIPFPEIPTRMSA